MILKFPTLIRMDDGQHAKPADDQLEKRIGNGQGRFGQATDRLPTSGENSQQSPVHSGCTSEL